MGAGGCGGGRGCLVSVKCKQGGETEREAAVRKEVDQVQQYYSNCQRSFAIHIFIVRYAMNI